MNYPPLLCAGLFLATTLEMPAATPITLDRLPLLFADDNSLASTRGVERTIHQAVTLDRPVLKADKPWEKGRVYLYGNVVYDPAAGKFAMWYGTPKPSKVLYATSSDGVVWEKPALDVFPAETPTNTVWEGAHSPSVLYDADESDPARRYKMMAHGSAPEGGNEDTQRGYITAYSADGIHWTRYPGGPVLTKGDDTLILSRDPRTGEYLCYHKRQDEVRGFKRRIILLSRSKDFVTWSKPEVVFVPDEEDDAWAKEGQRTDVYNMAAFPHAGGFVGLPTLFRVELTRDKSQVGKGQSPDDGNIDVQFVTSPDGVKWSRTTPRLNVLPRGAHGDFDKGAILGIATQPVNFEDKTWVYYTAVSTSHGSPIPPKEITIGRAEWRRDGFFSLDAKQGGGTVETNPIVLAKPRLVLNADATKGSIRVALLDSDGKPLPGYGFADCTPITGSGVRQLVAWKNQPDTPTGQPVRVAIEMAAGASLYSLSVE